MTPYQNHPLHPTSINTTSPAKGLAKTTSSTAREPQGPLGRGACTSVREGEIDKSKAQSEPPETPAAGSSFSALSPNTFVFQPPQRTLAPPIEETECAQAAGHKSILPAAHNAVLEAQLSNAFDSQNPLMEQVSVAGTQQKNVLDANKTPRHKPILLGFEAPRTNIFKAAAGREPGNHGF